MKFIQQYQVPAMTGGLYGRAPDMGMVNAPSSNPIMNNKAFEKAMKFAHEGYKMDKTNPRLNKDGFFQQYGGLASPGMVRNQLNGGLLSLAGNNFNPSLWGQRGGRRNPGRNNFGFSEKRYGQIGDINQYIAAANRRWR